jgi:hypothetical protein
MRRGSVTISFRRQLATILAVIEETAFGRIKRRLSEIPNPINEALAPIA